MSRWVNARARISVAAGCKQMQEGIKVGSLEGSTVNLVVQQGKEKREKRRGASGHWDDVIRQQRAQSSSATARFMDRRDVNERSG